jgi:hypothetical protein
MKWTRGALWINLVVGFWMIAVPFVWAASANRTWTVSEIVIGILLIAFSWWMLGAAQPPAAAAWLELLCGAWLVASPFVLIYGGSRAVMANNVTAGVITMVVAAAVTRQLMHRPTPA